MQIEISSGLPSLLVYALHQFLQQVSHLSPLGLSGLEVQAGGVPQWSLRVHFFYIEAAPHEDLFGRHSVNLEGGEAQIDDIGDNISELFGQDQLHEVIGSRQLKDVGGQWEQLELHLVVLLGTQISSMLGVLQQLGKNLNSGPILSDLGQSGVYVQDEVKAAESLLLKLLICSLQMASRQEVSEAQRSEVEKNFPELL